MRETCSSGSVRGAFSNERPYRERKLPLPAGAGERPFAEPTTAVPAGDQPFGSGCKSSFSAWEGAE